VPASRRSEPARRKTIWAPAGAAISGSNPAATAPPPNSRSVSNGSSSGFMTFLQGPRGCIGRKFAETEIKVLLCVLLSTFEFSRDETRQDPEETKYWRLVIRPKDGMYIKVTRLSQ
jgi:cytochrome P450